MSREIKRTSQFKKDVKRMLRQGRQLEPLLDVVEKLQNDIPLPSELRDHPLSAIGMGSGSAISNRTGCSFTRKPIPFCC